MTINRGITTVSQMVDRGLYAHTYWVGSVLQGENEQIAFLQSRYPDAPLQSIRAGLRRIEQAVVAGEVEMQSYGYTPDPGSVPINTMLSTGEYEYWVNVAVSAGPLAGQPAGAPTLTNRLIRISASEALTMEELQSAAEQEFEELFGPESPDTTSINAEARDIQQIRVVSISRGLLR